MIKTLVQPFKYVLEFMNFYSQQLVYHQFGLQGKYNKYNTLASNYSFSWLILLNLNSFRISLFKESFGTTIFREKVVYVRFILNIKVNLFDLMLIFNPIFNLQNST